jgi:hypothetical protein
MPSLFDLSEDAHGNLSLRVPPDTKGAVDQEIQRSKYNGRRLSVYSLCYTAISILQDQITALKADQGTRIAALEDALAAAETRMDGFTVSIRDLQAGSLAPRTKRKTDPTKRMGPKNLVPFGSKPDPHNDKNLVPDPDEEETISLALAERAKGAGLREICRRLDRMGRKRRGKPWVGGHAELGTILKRATLV